MDLRGARNAAIKVIALTAQTPKLTTETVEEFLARGGSIKKISGCPDSEGRVQYRSRSIFFRKTKAAESGIPSIVANPR